MLLDQRGFRRRNENLRRRRKWGRKSFALSGTDAPSHCLGNEGEHIDLSLSEARPGQARPGQCKCKWKSWVGYSPLKGCRIMLTGICTNKKIFMWEISQVFLPLKWIESISIWFFWLWIKQTSLIQTSLTCLERRLDLLIGLPPTQVNWLLQPHFSHWM